MLVQVVNFGEKTLLLGLAPPATPSHFVKRALQGSGIMEGLQVEQESGPPRLNRSSDLILLVFLRIPII